jgi:L-iditol 2-dehydrogenase
MTGLRNPAMMDAVLWYGPGDLKLEQRPVPTAIPGSLILKVKACAVCGSDHRIFREGNARITEPRILGHEISGEIVEVGEGVTDFEVGDSVSVGADIPCGKCLQCRAGRGNCCETNLAMGYQYDGGFAEFVRIEPIVVELGPIRKFAHSLSYRLAALAEPLACCLNGYERCAFQAGSTVVIFGAGPIGLMLAILGKQMGASAICIIEPTSHRRNKVSEFVDAMTIDPATEDAVAVVLEWTNGLGADVIFTACPAVETHEQAIAMVAPRGVVNLFGGLPKDAPEISVSSNHIHYREASVTGSHGSTPAQHKAALELIESGSIDLSPLVTHHIGLAGLADAMQSPDGNAIKVIVEP